MKFVTMALWGIVLCSSTASLSAQDKPMSPQEKAWTQYMTPGPMHEMLKNGEGKWKVTTTVWMAPDAPPQTSDGEAQCTTVLGGRYLRSEFHGMMMGQSFEGVGYDAYDNALGQFVSVWMDNMGTGIMTMRGKMDGQKKSVSYAGKMVDPVSKKEVDTWSTTTFVDNDHQTMEMFAKAKGKKFKTMEMKMERVK